MALSTILQISDQMTGTLRSIHQANQNLLNDYRELSGQRIRIDTVEATDSIADMTGELWDTERQMRLTREEQERFNESLGVGNDRADAFGGKLIRLAGAFAGLFSLSAAKDFATVSMENFDIQNAAERQLKTVLFNVQAAPGAFDALKAEAEAIQGRTIYGDEAMIAGAAEISTYISDEAAIRTVMGTLTNYASGMSGGVELNSQQMVEYATQLGKALNGTYDGLKDRGFELTDAQKEIIDNGTDMQKALVIDEVINQSWANLAEQMANTPQGRIIQFKNNMSDISEVVGGKVYPAVMELYQTANDNMPRIESMFMLFANGAAIAVYALSGMADAAGNVYQVVSDNWGVIGPIVYGASGAFVVYNGVLLAHQGYLAAVAVWNDFLAIKESVLAVRTGAATAAQAGFNVVLLASPITWFAGGVLVGVVALNAFVGMLNKAAGTSYSVTGLITGLFSAMGAGVVRIFLGIGDVALGVLQAIAEAVDFVMRTDYADTIAGWRDDLSSFANEKYNLKDAFDGGYAWGEGVMDNLKNFNPAADLSMYSFEAGLGSMTIPGAEELLGDISGDTDSIQKLLEVSEEDLKYLRDIAEQEVINRFTTAEIKVDMQNYNQVNSSMDLDGIADQLLDVVYDRMTVAAEGV